MRINKLCCYLLYFAAVAVTISYSHLPLTHASDSINARSIDLPTAFAPSNTNSIVFSKNDPLAFAASFETDSLFAFDSTTGAQLGTIATGDGAGNIALYENGARRIVAVANSAFIGLPLSSVTFIDATSPTEMKTIS